MNPINNNFLIGNANLPQHNWTTQNPNDNLRNVRDVILSAGRNTLTLQYAARALNPINNQVEHITSKKTTKHRTESN